MCLWDEFLTKHDSGRTKELHELCHHNRKFYESHVSLQKKCSTELHLLSSDTVVPALKDEMV